MHMVPDWVHFLQHAAGDRIRTKMMNTIADYKIQIKINPRFVRENEIVSLSGSVDKLHSLIGKVEQVEFDRTLEIMYKD